MKSYLPRFACPKSMTSKVYIDKKTKSKSRNALKIQFRDKISRELSCQDL